MRSIYSITLFFLIFLSSTIVATAQQEGCVYPEGDVNEDCTVSFNDLNIVLANWGLNVSEGDTNGDGTVNFQDLNVVLANWGVTCSPECTPPICPT